MPKESKHPHVSWRNGRPRFSPDQNLRAAGYKGKDLRHEDGRWFTLSETIDWSYAFVKERAASGHRVVSSPANRPPPRSSYSPAAKGYIYFLFTRERVKIGFSENPAVRVASLLTATSDPAEMIVVIEGSRHDERRLHMELSGTAVHREWFQRSLSVIRVMQREMQARMERLNWESPVLRDPDRRGNKRGRATSLETPESHATRIGTDVLDEENPPSSDGFT
ncbi:MAG: GIY-YIG nuclease family protein [Rhizobiaceae bacterium]|nr:GIY-YIG nuclease family protein [Rhizobiaceae bacterium]